MAGYRPTDWHVLDLEKDPTPGDPVRVKSLAKSLHDFADDVQDALRLVQGMAGEDAVLTMVGKTAEVFRDEFSGVPKNLKKLKKSYDLAGDALAAYWPKLERAQALADKALAKGREAQSDLSSAKSRLSSADSWVTRANKEADKYKDDPTGGKDVDKPDEAKVRAATRDAQSAKDAHTAAQSDVTSAQSALDAAKKMAADARQMREEAAGEAKRKLDEASDAGIQNRKWYEEVGDWFVDNWDTIVAVCKVVVAVLGIIALIIGGPILGAIVLIAALIVLADTLNKYMKGQASLWDVAFAALDCIPGMKGLTTLGGLAKGLRGLGKMGLKGMAAGLRGLGRSARSMLGRSKDSFARLKTKVRNGLSDPIDMATGAMFLPQTDVELPGALPLVFQRRVQSDYRVGWWFGPSWSSTVDQHLEIDELGVVFVSADGQLLSYPHPAGPDAPVLPDAGPRWPLARLENGGYRLSDPLTGITSTFGRPGADRCSQLLGTSDRNGRALHFEYDEHGLPTGIRSSGGYHLKLTTEDGRITALTLAGGAEDGSDVLVKRFGYTDGNLTEIHGSTGLQLRFVYDDRLRVVSWIDSNDSHYGYVYDDEDRCIAEGGEGGHFTLSLEYGGTDPAFPGMHVTTAVTPEGHVSKHIINDAYQVVAEIDPNGAVTRTEYDRYHHVTARTDALGNTVRIDNDEYGLPVRVVRPDGYETSVEYNELHLPVTIFQEDGTTVRHTYDERGNHLSVTDEAGATTTFAYDASGHLVSATDPAGNSLRVRNDPAGLPLETVDPSGATTRYRYDAFGRLSAVLDPVAAGTRLWWTVEGHLARRVGPTGAEETWTYDGEGNCLSHTDGEGRVTRYEYTHFDVLAAETRPDGSRYTFEHDAALHLTKVVNPQGLVWRYEYDPAGQVTAEVDFDGRRVEYEHDLTGRLSARVNAVGQRVTYAYDALDRLTAKDVDGSATSYEHDVMGRLLRMTSPSCDTEYGRDELGRAISESVDGRVLARTYDRTGRPARRVTPVGAVTTFSYDASGQLSGMDCAGRVLAFAHDTAGRETSRALPAAGLTLTRRWDPAGRIAEQAVTTAAGTLLRRAYHYRVDGHLTGVDDRTGGRRRFELDGAGRVTGVRANGWNENYLYDAAGNQTRAAWPAEHPGAEAQGERAYEGNRLIRAGAVHYVYDAAGRIVARRKARISRKADVWRYTWDAEDRLTSVTTPDGSVWRYRYDPLGRRTAKQRLAPDGMTVAEEIRFTWDGATLVEQVATGPELPGPIATTWDYDGLHPVAQTDRRIDSPGRKEVDSPGRKEVDSPGLKEVDSLSREEVDSRFFSIVTDLVGAPTELIDERGDIAWRARATLWGTTAWNRDATAYTPLRFPGQYFDPETGLHYNNQRHYDPETARYVSPDPLGLEPAPNPFAYVANPLQGYDPLGLAPRYANRPDRYGWGGSVRYGRTDHLGRPTGISASIRREMVIQQGSEAGSMWTKGWRGHGTLFNEARGHLLANTLGGAGKGPNAPHNLVTLTQNPTNHPHMYEMFEKPVADAARNGEIIQYTVTPIYGGTNPVPIRLEFSAFGNRGFSLSGFLDNPASGVRTP
ncbi:RHS repeat-associated core domain-containing protein [Streptomyces sp. MMBL 11-3]|uniref:RHS repeat-associated core domain-containing protein n=1 Tax=Streptomyces sp. MMBL 11-3 TaxID=3382639 RepID=UPI0039B5EEB0